jgi:stress response protein SCP2
MDVTEEALTAIVNEMAAEGFELDAMHFAMRESSKRPSMAFLVFYARPAQPTASVNDSDQGGS